MLKILRAIFSSPTVVVTSKRICGQLSQGRKDTPGVWYKT